MKEKAEIDKELRRQKYKSRDLSFNISKRLNKIGATVQTEFMSLKDEHKIDNMKQKVIDQRMTTMDAKKRSQLSIIDNQNKRQQNIYEYKAQIRSKKNDLKEEKEKLKDHISNVRNSRHLTTADTRSTNLPQMDYGMNVNLSTSNQNSINLTHGYYNRQRSANASSGRVNIRFTEEIMPINKQIMQLTTEMSNERKDWQSSEILQDRPESRTIKSHYSTRYKSEY